MGWETFGVTKWQYSEVNRIRKEKISQPDPKMNEQDMGADRVETPEDTIATLAERKSLRLP